MAASSLVCLQGTTKMFRPPPPRWEISLVNKPRIICSYDLSSCLNDFKKQSCVVVTSTLAATFLLSFSSEATISAATLQKASALPQDGIIIKSQSGDQNGDLLMMEGMTMKNFNPARYSGRWYEVASLKQGFAGQGQEDCHCTQGLYALDEENRAIKVNTFCVHGGPDGKITGIKGSVTCVSDADFSQAETKMERQEMIKEKCFLKFASVPFIPKLTYDVIDTDYDTFALVSGAKGTSFVQIYSRTPNPGSEFIEKYKDYLSSFGYNTNKIRDTPQDCNPIPKKDLDVMMTMPGMQKALTNRLPDPAFRRSVQFNPARNVFDTLKKLSNLYTK